MEFFLVNTTIWKIHVFLSLDEVRETRTLLGPLEGANLNQWH
jgi:hypothetical protein